MSFGYDTMITSSESELGKAAMRLTVDDIADIGRFLSILQGIALDEDAVDIWDKALNDSAMALQDVLADLSKGDDRTAYETLIFVSAMATHIACSVYASAQTVSLNAAVEGLPLRPLDAILASKATPPPRAMRAA